VAIEISEELDLQDALSRALACISGYKDRINQRSMMGSFEGYITYVIKSTTPFRTVRYFLC
jgi:ATP-dependent RNA helicase DDX21